MFFRLTSVAVVVSLLLTVFGLTACAPAGGGAAPPATTAPKPPTSAAPAPTTTAAPPTPTKPPVPQPKYGGILRYPISAAPPSFDAHRRPSYAPVFTLPIFSNLLTFDDSKTTANLNTIVPDLAEKWDISADGKTITFYLAKGVKWHDGSAFSADDVVYSLEKMLDPKRSSLAVTLGAMDRVEKVDANTVKVYLKQPSAAFLVNLSGPFAPIQPKSKAEVDMRSTDFLVGTGPFKFKSYTTGVSAEYVKNPDYFKKDASGKQLPYLDGVIINVVADRNNQTDALIAGRLDLGAPYGIAITTQENLDKVKKEGSKLVLDSIAVPRGPQLWLNQGYAPLKDVRVRRALAMLIDQKQIAIAGYSFEEWGSYDLGFFTRDYGLPPEEIRKIMGWDKPMDARVAEAKKLLADAGYASGFKLKMTTLQVPEFQRELTTLADMYKRHLNIDAETVFITFVDSVKVQQSGDFQLFMTQIASYLGDPDEVMGTFITGSPANFAKYSNPEADKLWTQQSMTTEYAKRKQVTQQLERVLLADLPAIPLHGGVSIVAWWPYVKGWVNQDVSYGPNCIFTHVWLDK
jgi:peptide/nickel transport system substrate-binding protein